MTLKNLTFRIVYAHRMGDCPVSVQCYVYAMKLLFVSRVYMAYMHLQPDVTFTGGSALRTLDPKSGKRLGEQLPTRKRVGPLTTIGSASQTATTPLCQVSPCIPTSRQIDNALNYITH